MLIEKVLKDNAKNIDVKEWALTSAEMQPESSLPAWKVGKRVLHGGRQEGVEVIEVDSGAMKFTVVPTRGMSIWRGEVGELSLGWDSPVREIVHPHFIDLSRRNGLGWLDGFGGWIVRCGLVSVGPPCTDGDEALTLHGRIDYLSAEYVEVRYETSPVARLVVSGTVEEKHSADAALRLATEISIEIGTAAITVDDTVTNVGDRAQEMQLLYHMNFGPPLLGGGAEMIAPIRRIAPRDARAAEAASDEWTVYRAPQGAEYTEQVYLMELQSDANGDTAAMLRAPDRASAALLRFNVRELPYFMLWKNEAPANPGYVTGLEPATSYPYTRPVERKGGRVPMLGSGESRRMRVQIEVLTSAESVQMEEAKLRKIATAAAIVVPEPFG